MMNYGYGPYGYSAAGGLFMLCWFVVMVVVIALIIWAIVHAERRRHGHYGGEQHPGQPYTPGQYLPGHQPAPSPHGPAGGQPPQGQPTTGHLGQPVQQGQPAQPQPGQPGHDEAMTIARRRVASGEITPEQFEEIRRALGE